MGKDIPGVPFPWLNDREEHRARQAEKIKGIVRIMWFILRLWILSFGRIGALALAV